MTHIFHLVLRRCHRHTIWSGLVALGLSFMFVPGALAQRITTEVDKDADFSKFKTFAIHDGLLRSPNPALNSELMKKRVEVAIERALTAKGLTKASGDANLNVSYILGSLGGRGRRTRGATASNIEGNFIIDLRDPTTSALVWHGVATEEEPNAAKLAGKVDDMVKKLMAKYPATK